MPQAEENRSNFSLMKLKVVEEGCGIHPMKFGIKVWSEVTLYIVNRIEVGK